MGVSIRCLTPRGREIDITPGCRSWMWTELQARSLTGFVDRNDFASLLALAEESRNPDVAKQVLKVVKAIKRVGGVAIVGEF